MAEGVGDPGQRTEILAVIAEGFLRAENPEDARQVASEAARVVDTMPMSGELVGLQMRVAALLLATEAPAAARRLVVEATAFSEAVRDEAIRAALLVTIVRVAVRGDDDTRDLLPAVVDPVYVIEDTELRAQTLIEIAEAYQAVGVGQSVTGLIQQAIPATRSVTDPFRRAVLFADLSERAFAAGESSLARSLVADSRKQLISGMAHADPGQETVASVARAVARDRGAVEAMILVSEITGPHSRAAGFVAIAASGPGPATAMALGRAVDAASSIDDPRQYVSVMTSVSHAYLTGGYRREALRSAELAAGRVAEYLSAMGNAEVLGRLAGAFALLDRIAAAIEYLDQFEVPYFRGLLAATVAEMLITEGREGVADDFLVEAFLDADRADSLADGLREKIVRGFARSGNYTLAIRTIERMSDRALRARAVAYLGYFADPGGGLSESQLADLRSVLKL